MTTAILAVFIVVALFWMMRVEARLREIFDRLERQRTVDRSVQEQVKIF